MHLPGRLRDTTLGDVLGMLSRARATGTLELIDERGRPHSIRLADGGIEQVDTDLGPRLGDVVGAHLPDGVEFQEQRVGELLLRKGWVTAEQLGGALRSQNLARLEALFELEDAALRFRVPRPSRDDPTAPQPLEGRDFLPGRPRARRAEANAAAANPASRRRRPVPSRDPWSVLGVLPGSSSSEVARAFRRLAGECHPDRFPQATAVDKVRLIQRFSELSQAYHQLCS